MVDYGHHTHEELQRLSLAGDESAMKELGRRVATWDLCFIDQNTYRSDGTIRYCEHALALQELNYELDHAESLPGLPEEYERVFDAGANAVLEWPLRVLIKDALLRRAKNKFRRTLLRLLR